MLHVKMYEKITNICLYETRINAKTIRDILFEVWNFIQAFTFYLFQKYAVKELDGWAEPVQYKYCFYHKKKQNLASHHADAKCAWLWK